MGPGVTFLCYLRERELGFGGKGTWFWRKVHSCLLEVLNLSKWKICDENVSFLWEGPTGAMQEIVDCLSLKVKSAGSITSEIWP